MIPGIPPESGEIIKKFVYAGETLKRHKSGKNNNKLASGQPRKFHVTFRSRLLKDMQIRKGFTENRFSGNDLKTYMRLQSSYKNLSFGILAEKDAGESAYNDFFSYRFELRDAGIIDRLVVGDYLFEFGQGLAVWGPYSFSKGTDATGPVIRKNRSIKSYTSSDENNFFRGAASKLNLGIFSAAVFYSNKTLDASIIKERGEIKSLINTGLHRTDTELLTKASIREKVYGASLNFEFPDAASVGLMFLSSEFSLPHSAAGFRELSGSMFNFYSASYSTGLDNLYLSGELAYDGKSFAWINNMQYSLDRRIAVLASVRSYDRSYNSLYSNGLGESSNNRNEQGFYLGVRWYSQFGLINLYFDQFKFPSASLRNPLPAPGNEMLINYSNKLSKKIHLVLRYKIENKELTDDGGGILIQTSRKKQSARLDLKFNVSKKITFRNRFEYSYIDYHQNDERESGFLTFQDIIYRPSGNLSFYTRFIFFQTDSFNSRIYEFENDLRGVMTNTPLYGKGMKWYLMIKYSIQNFMTLSIKYSELFKPEEHYLGSGLSEISGNVDNRFSFQIDLNY
jgi:hypothetical protein